MRACLRRVWKSSADMLKPGAERPESLHLATATIYCFLLSLDAVSGVLSQMSLRTANALRSQVLRIKRTLTQALQNSATLFWPVFLFLICDF